MASSLLFDAVIFDLDGTLVATDRYWIPAARSAARRAFAEFDVQLDIPENREWLAIVGLPLEHGLGQLFPSLAVEQIESLAAYCVEAEEELLSAGGAALLPGAREALDELKAAGISIGIASNCGSSYLNHVVSSLQLDRWASEVRCLDSPGIRDKSDMIEDLLLTFDTRRAVMVGDRYGDEESARSNAIPHVHVRTGYAHPTEGETADFAIEDLSDLTDRLRLRAARLEGVLNELSVEGRRAILGVTGRRASGKSLLARDLAQLVIERGGQAEVIELASFKREVPIEREDSLSSDYDLERLKEEVLRPGDASTSGSLLILEGAFLLDPRIATQLTRLLYVDATAELSMARFRGRDARLSGTTLLEVAREALAAEERFEARFAPSRADLILNGDVFFGLGAPPDLDETQNA